MLSTLSCDIKTISSLTEYKKMLLFNCQAPELHLAPLQNLENLALVACNVGRDA
jgi:hypothetical protein